MTVHNIYFSAKGTTEKCAKIIAGYLGGQVESRNWLDAAERKAVEMGEGDVLLFSMPVYGGFIPRLCAESAEKLNGHGAPAIIAAVYGNRHYDDALIQMKDLLTRRGFTVIAAGAFIAEHSVFPSAAAGRPDEADAEAMKTFAQNCAALLERPELRNGRELKVPGNASYDPGTYKGVPFKPEGGEKCTKCGRCAEICPVSAINAESPAITDAARCISCGACIRVCPEGARGYRSAQYSEAEAAFAARVAERREAETFYIA